jgi:hypothetical protein
MGMFFVVFSFTFLYLDTFFFAITTTTSFVFLSSRLSHFGVIVLVTLGFPNFSGFNFSLYLSSSFIIISHIYYLAHKGLFERFFCLFLKQRAQLAGFTFTYFMALFTSVFHYHTSRFSCKTSWFLYLTGFSSVFSQVLGVGVHAWSTVYLRIIITLLVSGALHVCWANKIPPVSK